MDSKEYNNARYSVALKASAMDSLASAIEEFKNKEQTATYVLILTKEEMLLIIGALRDWVDAAEF